MSKGGKILILVVLMFVCSTAFGVAEKAGRREVAAFFAFFAAGLLIAILGVALSRGSRSRRD